MAKQTNTKAITDELNSFVQRNGLSHQTVFSDREFTPEEIEHMRQAVALQNVVEKVDFRRQIEG